MAKVLSIVAAQDFQDKEYADSRAALELAGHKVYIVSTDLEAQGSFGIDVIADFLISDVNCDEFDAIMFIGGGGCAVYFDHPEALKLAQAFYKSKKITAAICAAPIILMNAGLLKGKRATCWEGGAEELKKGGVNYTGAEFEKDGHIITANGPLSASDFGRKIAENLKG